MGIILWAACLVLIPQADEEAAALLKAVQEKTQKAKSLRLGVQFWYSESGEPSIRFSGEFQVKGANQWLVDFVTAKGDGLEQRFLASCDGLKVGGKGFGKETEEVREPDRIVRQFRDWCGTSLIVIFNGLTFHNLNLSDNNLPAISEVKSIGREKVGEVDARVITYLLSYPTNTKVRIRAWIDPVALRPLKRDIPNGMGGGYIETVTSFEVDPEIPDSTFAIRASTETDQAIARLTKKGIRQLTDLRQAIEIFNEHVGRYPSTAEGLESLVRKPKDDPKWKGPYLDDPEVPKDPWGNAYLYTFPGKRDPARFDLSSLIFSDKYKLPLPKLKELLAADIQQIEVEAALKAIIEAQIKFQALEPDANGATGFWMGDISGLYRYLQAGAEVRLIPRPIAEADPSPLRIKELSKDWPGKPVPYHGYLISVFSKHVQEGRVKPYHTGNFRSKELFGAIAYPADYPKGGRYTMIIDGNLNTLRRDLGGKAIDTCPSDEELMKWRSPSGD